MEKEQEYYIEKEQAMLETSYDMYEQTIKNTKRRMKMATDKNTGLKQYSDEDIEDKISSIKMAQDDIVAKYLKNGGDIDVLKSPSKRKQKNAAKKREKTVKKDKVSPVVANTIKDLQKEEIKIEPRQEKESISKNEFIPSSIQQNSDVTYDLIPLPSKGECYTNKISKLPVSYLTAYDENMLVSPNLYRDNLVIETILEHKIMSDSIDPQDLLTGDRDAIILYLRASGYGNEYPISVTDPDTGVKFDTKIDLSTLTFKDFTLKGDENGNFDFELPSSKHKIKFKFLTFREEKELSELTDFENKKMEKNKVNTAVGVIDRCIDNAEDMSNETRVKVREALKTINNWAEEMPDEDTEMFNHVVTNRLEASIVSIDGNRDRKFIRDFVLNMNVKDSSSLRKYINNNEPGIDYKLNIKKPESLGGGSMEVFLQFDQFIFLNIPE